MSIENLNAPNNDQADDNEDSNIEKIESPDIEVTESSDIEVTESSDIEVTESSDIEVTESSDIEVTESSDIEVTESSDIEVTESSDIEVTEHQENNKQKVIKKKLIIKSKKKPDFDFSKYGKRRKSRIYAMFALYSYDMNHKEITLDELTEFSYESKKIPDSILSFTKEIVAGTINNIDTIDEIITSSSENWRFSRIQYVDKAILRMSIYALLFQKDISKSIVIDEALEISKIFSDKDSYKFINGILDAIQT